MKILRVLIKKLGKKALKLMKDKQGIAQATLIGIIIFVVMAVVGFGFIWWILANLTTIAKGLILIGVFLLELMGVAVMGAWLYNKIRG